MKSVLHRSFVPVLLALVGPLLFSLNPALAEEAAEAPSAASLAGQWEGKLAVGEHQLRLVFHVAHSSDGAVEASLDSPDQGATGIPITTVELDGDAVLFELGGLGASYKGTLTHDGQVIEGHWSQGGQTLPLTVKLAEEP